MNFDFEISRGDCICNFSGCNIVGKTFLFRQREWAFSEMYVWMIKVETMLWHCLRISFRKQ